MAIWTAKQLASGLGRIRTICMALPEATEELTWETSINFRVRNKIFCFPADGGSIMVKAERDELPSLLDDPRFSPAPYLARGGWVVLDLQSGAPGAVDWDEVRELVHSSYILIAPKKLGNQIAVSS